MPEANASAESSSNNSNSNENPDPKDEITSEMFEQKMDAMAQKNRELLHELKQAQASLSGRPKLPEDFDAERWQSLKEAERERELEAEKREEQRRKEAGEFDALKAKMIETHEAKLAEEKAQQQKLVSVIERQLIDNAAITELNKVQANVELLLPHVKTALKMVSTDNGEFEVHVVDSAGNRLLSKDGDARFMEIPEYIQSMREIETFAAGFPGTRSKGGGAAGNDAGAGGPVKKKADMSDKEKSAYVREHGAEAYRVLP